MKWVIFAVQSSGMLESNKQLKLTYAQAKIILSVSFFIAVFDN